MSTASADRPPPGQAPLLSTEERFAPVTGLPFPRTPLVGRTAELAAARALLLDEAGPLLTLTGPGGVGKTRLALAIAHAVAPAFADGAAFVDLSPIRDPGLVLPAIAQTLDVRETAGRSLAAALTATLKSRQFLLLLDNCEQVLEAAPAVGELLSACPALQVLATSRAPLRLRGEHLLPIEPLAAPDPDRTPPPPELAGVDAVILFVQRARAADPGFVLSEQNGAAVADICRRLDGLPLAIELAAPRLRTLSPAALLALLSQRLRVLTAGARDMPARQQTLRNAIAWSHDLLDPVAQALFARLAVFVGGCNLEAAAAVAGLDPVALADGLDRLVEQSLLKRDDRTDRGVRFAMLEVVREYALERLEASGEAESVSRAHAEHFTMFAEAGAPHLEGADQMIWLDRFEQDHANIRAAAAWLEQARLGGELLRLAYASCDFLVRRGHVAEGRHWLERALALAPDETTPSRAQSLDEAGFFAWLMGDLSTASARQQESLAIWTTLDDAYGRAHALHGLGLVEHRRLRYQAATPLFEEAAALWHEIGDDYHAAWATSMLGAIAFDQGDLDRADSLQAAALAAVHSAGDRAWTGIIRWRQGRIAQARGRIGEAVRLFRESLSLLVGVGDRTLVSGPLMSLTDVAMTRGQVERAARWLGAAEALVEELGIFVSPLARARNEQIRDAAITRLGEANFATAYATGRALSPAAVVTEVEGAATPAPAPRPCPAHRLSPRERQVLALLAQRQTDPEIAAALFLSVRTVEGHVRSVFNKLGVNSRRDASAFAARHGLA